jgi:hypothetical protein
MGDDVVACMKREMKLMIVSGYQLYNLYRLIKIRKIHSFFKELNNSYE